MAEQVSETGPRVFSPDFIHLLRTTQQIQYQLSQMADQKANILMAVLPSTKVPPKPDGPANLLFFGSFSQLSEEEFVARLLKTVEDHHSVFEAFAHDIYQNGRVLARKKYRLLSYAYRVLVLGLFGSFIAFGLHFAAGIG